MKIMIAFLVAVAVLASANVAEAKAGGGHAWKGMRDVFQADYDRAHKGHSSAH